MAQEPIVEDVAAGQATKNIGDGNANRQSEAAETKTLVNDTTGDLSVSAMRSEMEKCWLNGDTKAAFELALQVRDKLIAEQSESTVRLAYHYDKLTNFAYELGKEEQAREFGAKVTSIYRQLSERNSWASSAAEHYERQLSAIETMSFDERLSMYDASRALQQAYDAREFRKAQSYAEQLAQIYRSTMGERHPLAILLMAYIQVIRLSAGEAEFVDTQLQRARIELSQSVEPGHPLLGVLSSYLAYSSWASQDGDATERHAKEAFEILETSEVTFEPNYVDSLQMLAAAMTAQEKHDQAVEPLRKAYRIVDREGLSRAARLAVVEQILPAFGIVADDLWTKREFDTAESLMQEAHSIAVETFGEKSFRAVNIRLSRAFASPAKIWTTEQWATYDRASALVEQKRKAESEGNWEQALELAKERYALLRDLMGETSVDALNARFNVVELLFQPANMKSVEEQNRTASQAIEFFRVYEQQVGANNVEFINKCWDIMIQPALSSQSRLELSKKVLQGAKDGPGIDSFEYAKAFTINACLQLNYGLTDADTQLLEAIKICEKNGLEGSFEHCQALMTLGTYYYENSRVFNSRFYLEAAEEFLRKLEPTRTAYELAVVLNYLGASSFDLERVERSIDYYTESIQLFESATVSDDVLLYGKTLDTYIGIYQWCLYNAASTQEELRDYEKALPLLDKLIARFPEDSFDNEVISSLNKAIIIAARMNELAVSDSYQQRLQTIVDKNFADDPLERGRAELIRARRHLITNEPKLASEFLDRTFEWFKKIKSPDQIPEWRLIYFDTYILNLREMYEELHEWDKVVAVRRYAVAAEEALYDDVETLTTLQQELKLFEAVAELEPEQQSLVGQLLDDTRSLKSTDPANVDPEVLARSKDLMYRVIHALGPKNLACFRYAVVLSKIRTEQEEFQQASQLLDYALLTGVELLGETHEDCIAVYNATSRVDFNLGMYSLAIEKAERALRHTLRGAAEGSLLACEAELEVARTYSQVGDYSKAMEHVRVALNGFTSMYGRFDERVADALSIRGAIYYGLGQPELGHRDMLEAHRIAAKLFDDSDSRYLRSLASLAMSTLSSGEDFETSKGMFEDCIARYEAAQLTEMVDYVELLAAYADALTRTDDTGKARTIYDRALSFVEANPSRTRLRQKILFNVGILQRKEGDLEGASVSLSKSLQIQERLFGATSESAIENRFQYALTQQLLGNSELALAEVLKTLEVNKRRIERDALLLNDNALTNLLESNERPLDLLISTLISAQYGSEISRSDQELVREAYAWAFRNKGLSLDLSCRQNALEQRLSFDADILALRERQRVLSQELADLSLNSIPDEARKSDDSRREQLEIELSELRGTLAEKLMASGQKGLLGNNDWFQLGNEIDSKAVLLDFLKVRFFLPSKGGSHFNAGEEHYVAFCVYRDATGLAVKFEDLGLTADIDRQIDLLRTYTGRVLKRSRMSSEETQVEEYKEIAAPLYQTVFGKFREHLIPNSAIIISPDGALSNLPFHALVDGDGRYLIESCEICYVSSGRDLLREYGPVGKGTLVLANPNFDADGERVERAIDDIQVPSLPASNTLVMRGVVDDEETLLRSRWKHLPAAEMEAFDTKQLLDQSVYGPVTLYLGDEAIEEVFKASYAVRIVHLATHGYYIPLKISDSRETLEFDSSSNSNLTRLRSIENPLLRSGIVLAGANRAQNEMEQSKVADGWITAQEISRMDFRNTELVMLSACESGLGDVSSGQGVQGIRRAFLNAGAHNIVTSLFVVPDNETRELIQKFYRNFNESGNCRKAICQAQREMIQARREANGAAHPFYWASFVLFGKPN